MKKILLLAMVAFGSLMAKPSVATSIEPTAYFINQIAGDTIDVITLVGKGDDPHTYEPRPAQAAALAKADLYFSVGIEFENVWLKKFKNSFKNLKIIDSAKGIKHLVLEDEDDEGPDGHGHDHDHGDHHHHHHHHGGLDPHVWLDPVLVATQAENIASALIKQYPQNKELYVLNLSKFKTHLANLDKWIKDELAGFAGDSFIVYHPSWGYYAKRYNLEQIAIEIEGKEPSPKQLAQLINVAKQKQIKAIFVAPAFSDKAAKLIAQQSGASVAMLDPLAKDWDENLRQVTITLKQALSKE